jgi:hypothetical protein
MSISETLPGHGGRAQGGQFQKSQLEHTVKPLGVMALVFSAVEQGWVSTAFSSKPGDEKKPGRVGEDIGRGKSSMG